MNGRITIKEVEAIGFVKELFTGSNPVILQGNDNNEYLVKFATDFNTDKSILNESICHSLANLVGIRTPDIALIKLDKDFISFHKQLHNRKIEPGSYFGSKMVVSLTQPDFLSFANEITESQAEIIINKLANPQNLSGTFCFDFWIINQDRHFQNTLIEIKNGKNYHLAFDFDRVFNTSNDTKWNYFILRKLQNINYSLNSFIQLKLIRDFGPIYLPNVLIRTYINLNKDKNIHFVEKIENLPDINDKLEDIYGSLPSDWIRGVIEDLKELKNFLDIRRKLVRKNFSDYKLIPDVDIQMNIFTTQQEQ